MAVAQHYGFPTEFLDFSYSVEVAAYFATPSKDGEIGVIYCLNYVFAQELAINRLPPLINEDLKCVPRIVSQEGVFLRCGPDSAPQLMETCTDRFYFRQSSTLVHRGGFQPRLSMLPDLRECDSLDTYESLIADARRQHPEIFQRTPHISEARLYHPDDALSTFAENWKRQAAETDAKAVHADTLGFRPAHTDGHRTWPKLIDDIERGGVASVDAVLPMVLKSNELVDLLPRVQPDIKERICRAWDKLPARLLSDFIQPAFEMGIAARWIGNLCQHLLDAWNLDFILQAELALDESRTYRSFEPFAARLWGVAEADLAAFDFESKAPRIFFRSVVPLSAVTTVLRNAMPALVDGLDLDEAVKSDLLAFTDDQLLSQGYVEMCAMIADRFLSFLDTEQRWELWTGKVMPVGVVFARGDNRPFLNPDRVHRCGFP